MPASIDQLKTELGEIDRQLTVIMDTAAKDNGGLLSDEQREQFDALDNQYEAKLADIRAAEDDIEKQAKARNRLSQNKRLTKPDTIVPPRVPVSQPEPQGTDGAALWGSLGEQLLDIYGVKTSRAAQQRLGEYVEALAATGSNYGVDSEGGYLVQKQFATELFRRIFETGVLANRCRTIEIGDNANGLKMNALDENSRATGSRFGGLQVYWRAEAEQKTASKPKFRQIELTLQKLCGLWFVTDELLQDAVAIESVAKQAFPDEMAFELDEAILSGDGAGKPLGVLHANNPALVSVSKETGQAAATLTFANLVAMWSRMWAKSRQNAVWLINQEVEPQLYSLSFPLGTGGIPAFLPPGGLSQSPYSTLFGRPVIPIEHASALGTKGDILLADFSQYLLIRKGGIQTATSMHLRFDYDETAFRWVMRVNGQPLWNAPLTPYKGSATLSPFVTLNTRA